MDQSDADYVETVITDSGTIATGHCGSSSPAGHVNIMPNGGESQPGCNKQSPMDVFDVSSLGCGCHHGRAYELYTEFLDKLSSCQPIAFKCGNYTQFKKGECFDCRIPGACLKAASSLEGGAPMVTTRGASYFMETNDKSPLCGKSFGNAKKQHS